MEGGGTRVLRGIREIHKAICEREISVSELCRISLSLALEDQNLNTFISICKDESLSRSKHLDELQNKDPSYKSSLFGIPISVKDNFCTQNVLTTCGSRMLADFIPPYTATAVQRLIDANSVIIGKTNMDEFAMGSSSTTSYFGPTANHWMRAKLRDDRKPASANASDWYMAGGSSTGSAVSVASGACFASLGTDTGGSTRQPASLTGTVGFKPTYGLISRYGLVPLAHCLDVVSIIARKVEDTRAVFDAIVGLDENDLTTVDHKEVLVDSYGANVPARVRLGIPSRFIERSDSLSGDVAERFQDVIRGLGRHTCGINFEIVNLDLERSNLATECYTIISSAEISSNMSCYDGVRYGYSTKPNSDFERDSFYKANRDEAFGSEVKKRILLGNYFLLSGNREKYLTQALKLRRLISDEFVRAFEENQIDILITPSTPTTSVTHSEWLQKQDDNKLFREDYFLIPSNLANLPSISLPAGLSSKGLPVGLQIIGKKYHDLDVLKLAEVFESYVLNQLK